MKNTTYFSAVTCSGIEELILMKNHNWRRNFIWRKNYWSTFHTLNPAQAGSTKQWTQSHSHQP
jgi:hypothetical protein